METENKETELLAAIGRLVIRYLDYIFVFFTFPIIFDVRWSDPKIFIALGTLIIVRAMMPGANLLTMPRKEVKKIIPPVSRDIKEDTDGVVFTSMIDNTNMQFEKIEFPGLGKITTRKTETDDEVIASFPDFRTIRLKKNEISQLYKALLESEVKFFQPGKWEIMIKVKGINQIKKT